MYRFLLISDLHVTNAEKVESSASLISANSRAEPKGTVMFDELIKTIQEESISIDCVVCPGDLSDRADSIGLEFAWKELERVQQEIGAKLLVGTAGNHDVDSRYSANSYDPTAAVKSLKPYFPGTTEKEFNKYWAKGYCFYEFENIRILNLNSSYYHGYAAGSPSPEYLYGRVSNDTITEVCKELNEKEFAINVLLTHHHIVKNDHLYDRDNSEMNGAGKLIHNISLATNNPWVVFHGHQHYPELDYGRGSTNSPIVISAGSFSARLDGSHAAAAPNQFYVVDLETKDDNLDGWFPCGSIRAWNWSPDGSWERTPSTQRIPFGAGFGCRINPTQSASRVEKIIDTSGLPYILLKEVYEKDPQLKYLLPADVRLMIEKLKLRGIVVVETIDSAETLFRRA